MTQDDIQKKNKRAATIVIVVVGIMIGVSFASVPLYNLFCRVTGFGGTTQVSDTRPDTILDRVIKVNFSTQTARDMPWDFAVEQRAVKVKVGQDALINFKAYNPDSEPITGTAIYNVTPVKAGKYFHKTQCFCFDRQTLMPKQPMNMPVVFYIDPAIADDPDMDDVSVITLSYTFFKSDSVDLEKAMESYGDT